MMGVDPGWLVAATVIVVQVGGFGYFVGSMRQELRGLRNALEDTHRRIGRAEGKIDQVLLKRTM